MLNCDFIKCLTAKILRIENQIMKFLIKCDWSAIDPHISTIHAYMPSFDLSGAG